MKYAPSSLSANNLFDALMIIDDGIEVVDFTIFGARKPRCFSPWMNCAK
jgi:hypothetical protein